MTTAADDRDVEDAFEAYLAGRPVPGKGADLAAFAGAVRATATRPGRPNAALAELLVTGLLADQSSPSARTAPSAGSPPSRGASRIRNRRRTAMILPALLAKLLSAGAVAQAATGAGVALVVVTGAGAVGVLPDPLQNTVAAAVETVTPFDLPEGEGSEPVEDTTDEPTADEPLAEEPVAGETGDPVPAEDAAFDVAAWAEQGPDAYPSFGAWVSAGAHHDVAEALGVRFGELVSARARAKGMDVADLEAEGVDVDALELDGAALGESARPSPAPAPAPAPAPKAAPERPAAGQSAATQRGGSNGTGGGSGRTGGAAGNGGSNGNGGGGNSAGNGRN